MQSAYYSIPRDQNALAGLTPRDWRHTNKGKTTSKDSATGKFVAGKNTFKKLIKRASQPAPKEPGKQQ
jgi:hypothetical protein